MLIPLDKIHLEPEGDYWLQFQENGRWVPCRIRVESVGIENRLEVKSAWFDPLYHWIEDPEVSDFRGNTGPILFQPLPQPEEIP